MDGFPPDFHAIARYEIPLTEGYLWARTGACLEGAKFEESLEDRNFELVEPASLANYPLHSRWFMGLLICDPSDLAPALAWAQSIVGEQRRRILFLAQSGRRPRRRR